MSTASQIKVLPEDLRELATSARQEGFDFVDRLIHDFNSGANTFSDTGEALFEVRQDGKLVGIGGLNRDPYLAGCTVGRVRRVYVDPNHRCQGIGKVLMVAIERAARGSFSQLRLFTDTVLGAKFYCRLGYAEVTGQEKVSHLKRLHS